MRLVEAQVIRRMGVGVRGEQRSDERRQRTGIETGHRLTPS
jgi:hypothetical protein